MKCTHLMRGHRCCNRATVDNLCAAHAPVARLAALKAAVVEAAMAWWRDMDHGHHVALQAACAALAKAEADK